MIGSFFREWNKYTGTIEKVGRWIHSIASYVKSSTFYIDVMDSVAIRFYGFLCGPLRGLGESLRLKLLTLTLNWAFEVKHKKVIWGYIF